MKFLLKPTYALTVRDGCWRHLRETKKDYMSRIRIPFFAVLIAGFGMGGTLNGRPLVGKSLPCPYWYFLASVWVGLLTTRRRLSSCFLNIFVFYDGAGEGRNPEGARRGKGRDSLERRGYMNISGVSMQRRFILE